MKGGCQSQRRKKRDSQPEGVDPLAFGDNVVLRKLFRSDHHVGSFDHGIDLSAYLEFQSLGGSGGDRGHDLFTSRRLDGHFSAHWAFGNSDDFAFQAVTSGNFHGNSPQGKLN